MFAISFDIVISELKKFYGEPYNNAYYEISTILKQYNFYRTQGSVYLSELNDNISKLPSQLSDNFSKLHEQFQGDIEKNNGLISEAIGNTLNKAQLSKSTDLDSIKSQLNDISDKLNNEDGQIKNPLSKSLNKENLKNTIKNLKISSQL